MCGVSEKGKTHKKKALVTCFVSALYRGGIKLKKLSLLAR